MAKPKKTSTKAKPSVKIPDLKPAHHPKGGEVTISDLRIVKRLDKASPVLINYEPPPVKK